jgi:hypothetical protein
MTIDAQKPRDVTADLLVSDKLELWAHFQQQGGDDKNKMISTVSWLIPIAVGLLGTSVSELIPGKDPLRPLMACLLSSFGLLLCLIALVLIFTFYRHAKSRYQSSDRIEEQIVVPYLRDKAHETVDRTKESKKWFFKGVGAIFDFFFWTTCLVGLVMLGALGYGLNILLGPT